MTCWMAVSFCGFERSSNPQSRRTFELKSRVAVCRIVRSAMWWCVGLSHELIQYLSESVCKKWTGDDDYCLICQCKRGSSGEWNFQSEECKQANM
jgi:hypothetical protein